MSEPGHALEQEAERAAERTLRGPNLDPRVEAGLALARMHTGRRAAEAARQLNARAFTVGREIVFGENQYQPGTLAGGRLIAHELAHVAQQAASGQPTVQRQASGVVQMEPLRVTSTLQPAGSAVPNLDRLRGVGVDPNEPTLGRNEATIARNAPDPNRRLPFSNGAWNAQDILGALGQYDTLPGTDSDALRCVQAVAMASRIVDGPRAIIGFLRTMILEGLISRPRNPRERTATAVLEHVIGRIETERATFSDLIWAQEALHDLFYNDVSGTPEREISDQIAPGLDFGRNLQRLNVWCNTPQEVIAQANQLQPGEHLIVNTWQVILNTTFDDLSERGIEVPEGRSTTVNVNGRNVRIRRIRTDVRPDHTAIDPVRDHRGGHQLLIIKDSATGTLRLYEPEVTDTGRHLETLAPDGSNFVGYFHDQPQFGIYNYIQILGKLTPSAFTSLSQSPTFAP